MDDVLQIALYVLISIIILVINAVGKKSRRAQANSMPGENTAAEDGLSFNSFINKYLGVGEEPAHTVESDTADEEMTEEGLDKPIEKPASIRLETVSEKIAAFEKSEGITAFDYNLGLNLPDGVKKKTNSSNPLSKLKKEFTAKKAIVYSEIIKPKYF